MHHVDEEPHYDRVIPVPRPIKAFDVTSVIDPPTGADTMDQRIVCVEEILQVMFADMRLRAEGGRWTWLSCSRTIPSLLSHINDWVWLREMGCYLARM